jgi:hypothetical protein
MCVLKIMSFTILVLAEDPDLVLGENLLQLLDLLGVLKASLLPSSSLLKSLIASLKTSCTTFPEDLLGVLKACLLPSSSLDEDT